MSFRAAQDHNIAVGRDTTLLTPSSTRREDPVVTTRRRSRSLLSLAIVLILISLVMNDIVVELVLLLLVVNYIVDLIMCVILVMCVIFVLYSLPILEAPRLGRQPKHAVVKKIKLLMNIWPTCQLRVASGVTYIRQLIYEYIAPPVRSAPPPLIPVCSSVMCHQ
jgi:hypothetical protein